MNKFISQEKNLEIIEKWELLVAILLDFYLDQNMLLCCESGFALFKYRNSKNLHTSNLYISARKRAICAELYFSHTIYCHWIELLGGVIYFTHLFKPSYHKAWTHSLRIRNRFEQFSVSHKFY